MARGRKRSSWELRKPRPETGPPRADVMPGNRINLAATANEGMLSLDEGRQ